jgi:hypothetical protein
MEVRELPSAATMMWSSTLTSTNARAWRTAPPIYWFATVRGHPEQQEKQEDQGLKRRTRSSALAAKRRELALYAGPSEVSA